MAKRRTKAQREADEKAALRQRIRDIATGAAGCEPDEESGLDLVSELGAEGMSRFLPALREVFELWSLESGEGHQRAWLLGPHTLHNYENLDKLTDLFYEEGIRA